MEASREASLSVVEKGPGWRKPALSRDYPQWCRAEGPQRGLSHAVDGVLVLALDALPAVPSQLCRIEHGALDDGRLEVAGCCWWDTVLDDDAAKPGLGLAGLCYAASAILDKRSFALSPTAPELFYSM